ncbi:MAG: hypothetical protein K2P93_02555 [Alphaproteobacteria bacterium]|nr:hypothetical protein [Alphaproteobacteria bacterium]
MIYKRVPSETFNAASRASKESRQICLGSFLDVFKNAQKKMPQFTQEIQKLIADGRVRKAFASFKHRSKQPTPLQQYLHEAESKPVVEYKISDEQQKMRPAEAAGDEPTQKKSRQNSSAIPEGQPLPPPSAKDLMDTREREQGERRSADLAFSMDDKAILKKKEDRGVNILARQNYGFRGFSSSLFS